MGRNQNAGPGRRVVWAGVVGAIVVTTAIAIPTYGSRGGDLLKRYDATKTAVLEALPHTDPPGSAPHDHNDPATKNSLSRAGETGDDVQDPTTAAEKRANAAYVATARQTADPTLTTVPVMAHRARHPHTRYAMANGCYSLTRHGEPLFFKATRLGSYLLYDARRRFVSATGGKAAEPSPDTEWRTRKHHRAITFRSGSTTLRRHGRTAFRLTRTKGCATYPESQIGIKGRPHAGVTPYQEVRGYVDAHTHGMAFEFLGGAHCGRPWDEYGAPYALVDCPDHQSGVNPLETFLSGNPSHDPVGWPTFKDWPAPESLTHEGTYYRWLERSWRGGQRIFVNLLVENGQLCRLYPYKRDGLSDATCDEMQSVHRQARDMYQMQNYIDAQFGGPGKGFYRIVKNPFQARKVINAGKMAVIMGIETSVPFGCTFKALPTGDVPAAGCTAGSIDRQLTMVHKWGVRQMELVNKFDNALTGVAGDAGETGAAVNNANFSETGTYWDMQHCEPADPEAHDKNQYAAPNIDPEQQDALFGALGSVFGGQQVGPVYPPPDHCNSRGLTTLGEDTIRGLAKRHMIFDPDHMSVRARQSSLDQLERMKYAGVISSHSWATPDAYPRVYQLGGFITPYAGDSTGFVEKWRAHLGWADKRFYWGIGYGADMNGLGAQGDPRGADVSNPVTYPFKGMNGVMVKQQHAGKRVYDINRDGVAQYGLYPDWIQDLRKVADAQGGDGSAIVEDMSRGAEAYLQMWERAQGIKPDSCRNPELRRSVARVRTLVHRGMSTTQVMRAIGQPFTRLGRHSTFCAAGQGGPGVRMRVSFDRSGHVSALRRLG